MLLSAASAVRSGSNYAALEAAHIEGYVALYGQYHKQREGFTGSRRLMIRLGMYTSAAKAKYWKIRVLKHNKAILTTSIAAVPVMVPDALVARLYQKEMLW